MSSHPLPGRNGSTGSQRPLFLLQHESKRVLVSRPSTYSALLNSIRLHFPTIPPNNVITCHTKDLDLCEGQFAEIPEESWEVVSPSLNSVVVLAAAPPGHSSVPPQPDHNTISLTFQYLSGGLVNLRANRLYSFVDIAEVLVGEYSQDTWTITYEQRPISWNSSPDDHGMESGAVVVLTPNLRGRKPVIYLFSPKEIQASVKLTLVPQWDFSVIYPVVPIKRDVGVLGQQLEWNVRVSPGGNLTELNTGLDVTYLFWEAHTNPRTLFSPPPSPRFGGDGNIVEEFHPSFASLTNDNSVVLSVARMTPYLDKVLSTLGLHTEARTSFITYWLPSFLKHNRVALRFLSQSAYGRSAPLEVTPAPDVMTRIFMLFKGVSEEEDGQWSSAIQRGDEDVKRWIDIVGVDVPRTQDEGLFRVVEWGGMEVL